MSVYEEMSESQQFACRVIADHARATAFAIADGILPGNEGRNYVLRKIMRRAIYHGREHLGLTEPFFYKVCDFVVDKMHAAYPELETQRDFIGKMVRLEEERFGNALSAGLKELEVNKEDALSAGVVSRDDLEFYGGLPTESVDIEEGVVLGNPDAFAPPNEIKWIIQKETGRVIKAKVTKPDGSSFYVSRDAFPPLARSHAQDVEGKYRLVAGKTVDVAPVIRALVPLYDTFGTPRDIIRVKLDEMGLSVDEEVFNNIFDDELVDLQAKSAIGKTERKSEISPIYSDVLIRVGPTRFVGYDAVRVEGSKVTAIIRGDVELLSLREGEEGGIVLDTTPFYAESGGQVGDTGVLTTDQGTVLRVLDTFAPVKNLVIHKVRVEKGSIRPSGDDYLNVQTPVGVAQFSADTQVVTAVVDVEKRDATRRNHTATHLVHAALKEVLGSHVKQAGSVVAPTYLRFDFTHYQPMTAAEIAEVEDLVNRYILQNEPVTTDVMALEDAMRSGAVAMFGEKYGGEVRVLSVGDGVFSKELCGGTHVRATGDIGSFKITSDEAIASGVRRIRAITGFDAFERFREDERLIDASLGALNTQRDNLPNAIAKLAEELKKTRKEIDELRLRIATGSVGGARSNGDEARDIAGVKVLAKQVEGLDANGQRQLSDTLLARLKSGVVVLGRSDEGKVSIIVRVSDDLTDRVKAGNVIKEIVPIVGGKGGGRADMAEGGGTEPAKLGAAIDAAYGVVEKMLS